MHSVILSLLLLSQTAPAAPPGDLLTVAEKSGYKATARHSEVVGLCERLAMASPLVKVTEMGKSGEGRSLPLMIVADPPVATLAQAKASDRTVVFLFANIHAGEVCGKEALPILVRELTARPGHPLLKHLILLVAPIYNADGNERVSKDNRPGQVGPEDGMGQRANARGLDLNRDFMKLEAPESRALVKLLNDWDPSLVLDLHTTNGSHHRYTLTYEGPKNPAGDVRLIDYARGSLFPQVTRSFKQRSGFDAYYYGNFESDHTRWTSFPSTPRFGTTYVGLRNRLAILSEAYSYASYKDRITATRDFCYACLEFLDTHRDEVATLLDTARATTIERGRNPQPTDLVALRAQAKAFPTKVSVLGFVERLQNGRSVATPEPKDYLCDVEMDFQPTVTVQRPFAYLIPPGHERVVDVLKAHGIALETYDQAVKHEVEIEKIDQVTRSRRPFEGHQTLDVTVHPSRSESRVLPAGTTLVRTAQPLGTLAVYLLEPRSDDSLATWNYFDDEVATGKDFPVLKVRQPIDQ